MERKCASSLTTGQLRRERTAPAEDAAPRLVTTSSFWTSRFSRAISKFRQKCVSGCGKFLRPLEQPCFVATDADCHNARTDQLLLKLLCGDVVAPYVVHRVLCADANVDG